MALCKVDKILSIHMQHTPSNEYYVPVFAKSAGLSDKTRIFSFCPAKTFSLSDKCPVILKKENNILTTNIPSVLQILICPAKDYSLSDSCPASVENISRRLMCQCPYISGNLETLTRKHIKLKSNILMSLS